VTFYAQAVRRREERDLSRDAAEAQLERFPSGRVLWVDDRPADNRLETQALRALGVDVDVAATNAEATAYVAARDYDVVVSDIGRGPPEERTAGLRLPAQLAAAGRVLPLVYYVGRAEQPRTPGGELVVDAPSALFAELRRRLEDGRGR
jgi:CheY-like chemotaxis protein